MANSYADLPGEVTEEELQRHIDSCVENWKRILGPDLPSIEAHCEHMGITLRAVAEDNVRAWFAQKVRTL